MAKKYKSMIIFKKGNLKKVSDNLSFKELECRCMSELCIYQFVDSAVIDSFEATRKEYGHPIQINSAFRCQSHNKNSGGLVNSFHTIGFALDITPFVFSGNIFKDRLDKLAFIAAKHFNKIKIYDSFIHCQNEPPFQK